MCGSLAPHHELEETLAAFKGTEAALVFASGYAAAVGTICALLDRNDVIVIDKLAHACIVDGARQCGAKLRVFAHNDLGDLEKVLQWAASAQSRKSTVQRPARASQPRILIVTESVFSMDGDCAPLRKLVELKEQHGAWLMVDEAHATGLYGARRRGLAEALDVADRIEVQMGTLGKALGASGGYICGSRLLVDYLINRARTFIFSTAPVPAAAAAATAGVRLVQSSTGEALRQQLWRRVHDFRARENRPSPAIADQPDMGPAKTLPSAIVPLIVGDEVKAVEAATRLRELGFLIPAVRYPTVARGAARLRLTFSAAHSTDDVAHVRAALETIGLTRPGPQRSECDPGNSVANLHA